MIFGLLSGQGVPGGIATVQRLPNVYCEILTDGNASVLTEPLSSGVGSTRAPRTSMVCRTCNPVSEISGANIADALSVAPPVPVSGTRISTKSETPLHIVLAGHCRMPLV